MPLDVETIVPGQFLDELMVEWRLRLQQQGATASVDVAPDAPRLEADKPLLKRVFGNLIQNAITHSANPVTLHLTARRENGGVLFTVADNGPGIPREYHEIIFRKFEQVKTPNIPRVRSSGLGLAFCKMAVDAHGGRIWVQSTEGPGSSIHVLLPQTPPRATTTSGAGAPAAAAVAGG